MAGIEDVFRHFAGRPGKDGQILYGVVKDFNDTRSGENLSEWRDIFELNRIYQPTSSVFDCDLDQSEYGIISPFPKKLSFDSHHGFCQKTFTDFLQLNRIGHQNRSPLHILLFLLFNRFF